MSCTDHESDAAYNAQGSIADELNRQATDLQSQVNELKRLLDSKIDEIKTADIEALNDRIEEAESAINEAKSAANTYTDQKVANAAVEAQTALDVAKANLEGQLEACHEESKQYTDSIKNVLQSQLGERDTKIVELYEKYGELDGKIKRDSILLEEVRKGVGDLNGELNTKVDTADFNAVKAAVDSALAQSKANKDSIEAINAKLINYVTKTELNDKASELAKAFKDADDALKEEIMAEIEKLQKQLNELFNAMVNMITGIEIQATESPISGYENYSCIGVEAHILGSYYGYAKDGEVKFLNGQTVIPGNNEPLIDSESGENAGIVYATINPSNMDFSGITLKVVDSQGNEAPFTATVEKSDRVLKYGFTRAGNKSNLYAVKINLDKSKVDAAKTWTADDATALKDAAKNVLDKLRKPSTNRLNLKEIASSIEQVVNNRLTAYALEAEQEITDGTNTGKRFITSRMNLAATAIKPLSYIFLKGNPTIENIDLPRIPTLQSKFNFDDYTFNWTPIKGLENIKTSVTLKDMPDISTIKIDGAVPAPDVTTNVLIVGKDKVTGKVNEDSTVTFNLSELGATATVTIGNIDVSGLGIKYDKKDQTYDVTIPMDDFNKIVDNINSQVGNMVNKVNDLVNQVKGYAETIDGKYITRINEYIQRFENLLRKSNSLLQPALFYTTSTGPWNQLSREQLVPTYMKLDGGKASTIFIASSYNGEILCPAYKRCISVTRKPEGATVSGTNLGEVVGSETRKIGFEADKAGVYELTYEAVDFSGVYVSKKFYVKVVE